MTRAIWVVQALTDYHVPRSWWPRLGTAKAAGTVALLVGLFVMRRYAGEYSANRFPPAYILVTDR